MMKINRVIEALKAIRATHGNIPVLVSGYEMDYDEPSGIGLMTVADRGQDAEEEEPWNGRYEPAEYADPNLPRFRAAVIPR